MTRIYQYARRFIALIRGVTWICRRGVQAAGVPLVSGPRCRLRVARGGTLVIGHNFCVDRDVEIVVYAGGRLELGDYVYIGHGSTIAQSSGPFLTRFILGVSPPWRLIHSLTVDG